MDQYQAFNFYSFFLRGEERIYYAYIKNETEEEILDWAARFNFIKEEDFKDCSNIRELSHEEVKERNQALYKEWYEKYKDSPSLCGMAPPTIGEVLLT